MTVVVLRGLTALGAGSAKGPGEATALCLARLSSTYSAVPISDQVTVF
jgi:hypothetical protein